MRIVNSRESVIELTRLSSYDRFPDGRPRVPDDLIERMKSVTTEQAWGVLRGHGYNNQFEGNWFRSHPERTLVGRAVTAMMVPRRPDLNDLVEETGKAEGRIGGQNSWVIDTLVPGDVMVVDMFSKVKDGTFVGDNLSTSLRAHTKAGAVIDGGVRDFQGILMLPDIVIFCRGIDPTAIAEATLVGINIPIRIGQATVLPGDVVLGTVTGLVFVPPHLAQEVVEKSEDIHMRDAFGKQRLMEGRYTPGEIDTKWTEQIEQDYQTWLKEKKAQGRQVEYK
jgi:4-hydroxy-4-methyl-2-oxoglutarate aldolase